MTPALIRTRRAAFGYGGEAVVAGVDLEVEPGAFLGIVGPNGSGKTTLFRGLLGLIAPLAGEVETARESVGYVPQRETLDPVYPLTVEEVVRMGAYGRLRGWRAVRREERRHARACLEEVELGPRRKELFASLSGGQRQRALIARALVMRPRILLLDEPTSGVDARAQQLIFDLLQRLQREDGLAVLLVSHQIPMLRNAVDGVLWVAGGRVERGEPEEMLRPERLDLLYSGAPPREAESGGGR